MSDENSSYYVFRDDLTKIVISHSFYDREVLTLEVVCAQKQT